MNYYEHHLGDYAAATGHLTWDEDMAYTRLLRAYYHAERAIPDGQQYRLARAQTSAQRKAVDAVLAEFFVLVDGSHTQKRADEEIARFKDKQSKAKASANARWSQSERNANASPNAMRTHSEGNAPRHQTPDTNNPHTPAKRGQAAVGLKAWLETVKADGQQPVPPDDAVFAYAAEVGIPTDFLRLAWLEFRHRYTQPEAKRYRDWRLVFRKAVRGNWLKLWWLDPTSQQYTLTTVGQQAQRAHDDRKAA